MSEPREEPIVLRLAVRGPYSLVDSLRIQRFGRGDPTSLVERTGMQERYAKCSRTAAGPVTLVAWTSADPEPVNVEVALYGEGAKALVPRLRDVLGLDDAADFVTTHPRLAHLRLALRSMRLTHALSLPELHAILVLQQRITFVEAARSWRQMVEVGGQAAPGPLPLLVPPCPEDWLALRQPGARALGIDAHRWRALQHAARAANEVASRAHDRAALEDFVMRLPGTGHWTTGLLRGLGTGDADAIVLGDVHLPHDISALFTDVPMGSDEKMVALLEPFRPHRFRLVRALMGSGRRRL